MRTISRAFIVLVILFFCLSSAVWGQETFGNVIVSKLNSVEKDCLICCDIDSWPAVIGKNIKVKIRDMQFSFADANDALIRNELADKTAEMIRQKIDQAESVELADIGRGDGFFILAKVVLDGNDISDYLIASGLARKITVGESSSNQELPKDAKFVASQNSKVFHCLDCKWVQNIDAENLIYFKTRQEAIDTGRRACKSCEP